MLALGLRLIKAAQKGRKVEETYLTLSDRQSVKMQISKERPQDLDYLKHLVRSQIRSVPVKERTVEQTLLQTALAFLTVTQEAGIFRFIWHRNNLVFAFYQSLTILNFQELALLLEDFYQVNSGLKLNSLDQNELKAELLFPDPEIGQDLLLKFDEQFDKAAYIRAIFNFISI